MYRILYILMVVCISLHANAQEVGDSTAFSVADSVAKKDMENILALAPVAKPEKVKRDWSKWHPSAKKATWLALIPGGGQIYNRKYWKLPIVYGGFMGCIYAWRWNGQMYKDYFNAYKDITDDDPETKSYEDFLHLGTKIDESNISRYQELFRKRKDTYRRYRDLSVFCLIGVYAISIIDAYVDASLSEFDLSDDLTLRIHPTVLRRNMASRNVLDSSTMGINCSLTF